MISWETSLPDGVYGVTKRTKTIIHIFRISEELPETPDFEAVLKTHDLEILEINPADYAGDTTGLFIYKIARNTPANCAFNIKYLLSVPDVFIGKTVDTYFKENHPLIFKSSDVRIGIMPLIK